MVLEIDHLPRSLHWLGQNSCPARYNRLPLCHPATREPPHAHPAFTWAFLLTCLAAPSVRGADDPPKAQGKPEGQEVKLPVTRDTWFSQVGNEANCNLGGSSQLKLKAIQEMSLIDVDPRTIKGRVMNGATLYLRRRASRT